MKRVKKNTAKMNEIRDAPEKMVVETLPKKELLRVSEAADYFGVHERTIRLWIDHGKLIAEKPTGTIFISRESIKNFRLYERPE